VDKKQPASVIEEVAHGEVAIGKNHLLLPDVQKEATETEAPGSVEPGHLHAESLF